MEGMPEPAVLRLLSSDGETMVISGRLLVYRFDSDDLGMRNLAIVALTDAKQPIKDVAAVFGMTATYVSILRSRARARFGGVGAADGSAAETVRAAGHSSSRVDLAGSDAAGDRR